ncbi:hypothetical protein KRX19_09615 [Cardiobacteriaceae bacterium TAE3-ERU3]|nr:hypothetical protein [Cardiobacteriaceae bacterium TAE3-ERU3]
MNQYGQSIRGEAQAQALREQTGEFFWSEIRKNFPNKREGVSYQDAIRDRYRRLFGDDKLPGNLEHLRGKKK